MLQEKKISDVFEKIFIVNLDSRKDRLESVTKEINLLGLFINGDKVQRFSAICPERQENFPSIGARGLFLSHLKLLKEAKKNNFSSYLVIEDDAFLDKRMITHQNKIAEGVEGLEWDLIYFGNPLEDCETSANESFLKLYEEPILTTTMVAFHSRIFDKLEKFLEDVLARDPGDPLGGPQHVDGAYNMFKQQNPEVKVLLAVPDLVSQKGFTSDITAASGIRRFSPINSLFSSFISIKRRVLSFLR